MIDEIIKIEAKFSFTIFPRPPKILGEMGEEGESNFGIVNWEVTKLISGTIPNKQNIITILGTYEEVIEKNKTYTILAKETENPKHGKQFQMIFYGEVLDDTNVSHQKNFLSQFLSEGQVTELYKIHENPLELIKNHNKEEIVKAWGIGDFIAERIIERYEKIKDYSIVYIELDKLGLTPTFIQKLISIYKNPTKVINVVKKHPYQLCFDVDGIGFKTADRIALSCGIEEKSPERVEAFINYKLEELAQSGNSYVTSGELTKLIFEEFDGKENILEIYDDDDTAHSAPNNISEAINHLQKIKHLTIEDTANKAYRKVYLTKYYILERSISNHLKRLNKGENNFVFDKWEEKIAEQEKNQGWSLTDEQKAGVEMCLKEQVCFITGGAGCGKTSVLSAALSALNCFNSIGEHGYSFSQCSLSGKAAARMSEVTGAEGFTIHRLLGFDGNKFTYSKDNPLSFSIIVVDEISLIGGDIFLSLLEAIKTGSKLIILGDMGQLESIGCMNLAYDMYKSKYIKKIELTKIHRQATKSGIILLSQDIRHQRPIFDDDFEGVAVLGELEDMILDISVSKDGLREKIVNYFKEYYESDIVKNIMDIQILVAVKERGDCCVAKLNKNIQEIVNPPQILSKRELVINKQNVNSNKKEDNNTDTVNEDTGSFVLREEDKIMCIKNSKVLSDEGIKTFIFNGWSGIIESIDTVMNVGIIYFPHVKVKVVMSIQEIRKAIVLGYASTIHKYQGSSAKVIIGSMDYSVPPKMRTKELLYTLVTRAEKKCILLGQRKAISEAIKVSGVTNKNTFLLEMLDEEFTEETENTKEVKI